MAVNLGDIIEGKVVRVKPYGAFVDLGGGQSGMVHISEIAYGFVKEIGDHLKEGDAVKVKVIAITEQNGISLSIKATLPKPERPAQRPSQRTSAPGKVKSTGDPFEDMMNEFKRASDDKMNDLRRNMEPRRGGQNRKLKK